jgi:acetyltransferase-like isoleucine patch superfamily enzyme
MLGLRSRAEDEISRLWFAFYQIRHREVHWGSSLTFHGIPIFHFVEGATIRLGDHLTFTSSPRENLAGLTRKCSVHVGKSASLVVGDHCGFSGVSIYCSDSISIGHHLTCGANVSIWDTDFHPLNPSERREHKLAAIKMAPVVIGDDVFIGANSIILKGVTVRNAAIIAAGSVVTRDIPQGEVWGGNPAQRIR